MSMVFLLACGAGVLGVIYPSCGDPYEQEVMG